LEASLNAEDLPASKEKKSIQDHIKTQQRGLLSSQKLFLETLLSSAPQYRSLKEKIKIQENILSGDRPSFAEVALVRSKRNTTDEASSELNPNPRSILTLTLLMRPPQSSQLLFPSWRNRNLTLL